MNKTYRVVWNESTNTWVAVAEIATARGKSGKVTAVIAAATVVSALFAQTAAQAESLKLGNTAVASGSNAIAVGVDASASSEKSIAIGESTKSGAL